MTIKKAKKNRTAGLRQFVIAGRPTALNHRVVDARPLQ